MVELNIYIISTSESSRREFQKKQFSMLGIDFNFFDAITSNDIPFSEYLKNKYAWERPISFSEYACYKSHRELWFKCIEINAPIFILEDDALVSKDISKILKYCLNYKNADLVNFENRARKKIVSRTATKLDKTYQILRLYYSQTGAAGYMLWPSGASKIISCEKRKGIGLADAQISNCSTLKAFQIEPSPIVQMDMITYYNLPINIDQLVSSSSVSGEARIESKLSNRLKRVLAQLRLLKNQIFLMPFTHKRLIRMSDTKKFLDV